MYSTGFFTSVFRFFLLLETVMSISLIAPSRPAEGIVEIEIYHLIENSTQSECRNPKSRKYPCP